MKTPYFITNKNEFFDIIAPELAEFGYNIHYNNYNKYNLIVLDDCNQLGIVSNYTEIGDADRKIDRYQETDIHKFLKVAAELMGKEYKPFLRDKDVVWCPAEELAKQVLEIANKLGYEWYDKTSFIENSNWFVYKQETCYYISEGMFGSKQEAILDECNIISAEEFINFYKEYLNMEEKRNIQVTFEQAKEWYRSDNQTLKTLALSAYSKEELEALSFEEIFYKIDTSCPGFYHVPDCENKKWSIINKLAILAQYFNSRSFETTTQYFIKGKFENEIQIGKHAGVRYPGVVYFNNPEDLSKSIKLIGEDINLLF